MVTRRNRRLSRRTQDIAEEVEDFTQDALENGVEEAVDNKAEELVHQGAKRVFARVLGAKNPALWFLPEFIKAQRGYGVVIRDDLAALRLAMEAEALAAETILRDVEGLFDDESESLSDFLEDQLYELEEIAEDIEQTELEDILDDIENETPEEEVVESEEYEDGEKKCRSISLRFGDDVITFNTCDRNDNSDDDETNERDEESDEDPKMPDIPANGFWCPMFKVIASWSNLGYYYDGDSSRGAFKDYKESNVHSGWMPSTNSGKYREWLLEQEESGYLTRFTNNGGWYHIKSG